MLFWKIRSYCSSTRNGKKCLKIPAPSSGGTGIRLNNIRKRLIIGKKNKIIAARSIPFSGLPTVGFTKIEKTNIKINDIIKRIKFDAGPAKETIAISLRVFLKFKGFTGTGFAQPNNGRPVNVIIIGRITVPIMSICTMGLRVKRPRYFAVGSPNLSAAKACENS